MASRTEAALESAEAALDDFAGAPQPGWVVWVDRTELEIMSGRCWAELNRPLRAVPLLEAALVRYDSTHARDKALYLSWLTDAYTSAGEVEQAAGATGRALELCHGVVSVRPRQRLAPVLQHLSAHHGLPAVDALLAQTAA